jgi:uncharacterized membrane protein HdeD (DUF308 family)
VGNIRIRNIDNPLDAVSSTPRGYAFRASAGLGGLSVIVGVLFLGHPGEGLLTLTLLLIVFFMVEGISKLIFALTIRPFFPNWGWVLASGIIGILLSFYLWAAEQEEARQYQCQC